MERENTHIGGWLNTTRKLLIRPGEFFESMSADGGMGPSIAFLAACSALSAVLFSVVASQSPWVTVISQFANGFLTPFVLALLIYLVSRVLCRSAFTFQSLLKINAYAQVTLLFSWIPGIGWVAGLGRFYLIGLGMVRVGRLTPWKAASVILGAVAVFMVLYRLLRPVLGA